MVYIAVSETLKRKEISDTCQEMSHEVQSLQDPKLAVGSNWPTGTTMGLSMEMDGIKKNYEEKLSVIQKHSLYNIFD